MPSSRLFDKWKYWLHRIKEELAQLVLQQSHFHDLQQAVTPYIGQEVGVETARWMAQGYAAYSCMAIRRLVEQPSKRSPRKTGDPRLTISLIVLLNELLQHPSALTRDRQRRMYLRHIHRHDIAIDVADRVFSQVARRKGAKEVSVSDIRRDIAQARKVAKRIGKYTDKVYAHTERDRRRIGRPVRYGEIDAAIKTMRDIHARYTLVILGRDVRELVPSDERLSVMKDLRMIWR
jgi:hypothetical protein